MPICNTAAMNHHLYEISSQVAAEAHAVVILDGAAFGANPIGDRRGFHRAYGPESASCSTKFPADECRHYLAHAGYVCRSHR
jgi:hypothetical protein